MSRRAFLAASAAAGGLLAGLWSCEEEPAPPRAVTTSRAAAAPPRAATARAAPATSTAATSPGTAPATQTALGSADLGAELFPDAQGRAIAKPTDAPVIVVRRSDWTAAGPNLTQIRPMNGVDTITVHHTAGEMRTDAWRPTAGELEHIRGFHAGAAATDRQWADIAYHFVVDRAGRVWQARPLAYQGAHVKGHNEHNLGIVLLGNFETQTPSAAQLWSLAGFIGFVRGLYAVPLDRVFTHGELGQTNCPGKTLQSYMNRTRRAWAAAEHTSWTPRTT
jgi:hypothetical protein